MEPVEMTRELATQLRVPFPPEVIGKKPKLSCKACSNDRNKVCAEHKKAKCARCGNYISTAHIHLDFTGHAEVTDRILQVDPFWDWEPFATDQNGLPKFDELGGLWIRLTIAGVTRIGYGDADGKKGTAANKEVIGDAIRNAAMRFGIGLDLWGAKFKDPDENQDPEDSEEPASAPPAQQAPPQVQMRPLTPDQVQDLHLKLANAPDVAALKVVMEDIRRQWNSVPKHSRDQVERWVDLSKVRVGWVAMDDADPTPQPEQEELALAGAA